MQINVNKDALRKANPEQSDVGTYMCAYGKGQQHRIHFILWLGAMAWV